MSKASYLIAKYVSDVFRNEPKNVGVIVWIDGLVRARFLGEKSEGIIEGRSIRSIVDAVPTYKQWVIAWRKMILKDSIKSKSSAEIVRVADERFLDVVIESGRGSFILERGGELLEDITKEKMPEILDFLFTRLVSEPEGPDREP